MEKMNWNEKLESYLIFLEKEERSVATRKQYRRETKRFLEFLGERMATKELLLEYKAGLEEEYQPVSVNTKLAAVNSFLSFIGRADLRLKFLRIQQKVYCSADKELTKEEYMCLIKTAEEKEDFRLSLLIQTLCSIGIRVSELKFITVEGVEEGEITICLKGKTRVILIPEKLRKILRKYVRRKKLDSGSIFVTRSGKPMDRSNIWKMLKSLCRAAGICARKVFPHNLRHLFARTFYEQEKDIAKLADLMGHSSIDTTRIYTISSGKEHRQCMDALGLVIGGCPKEACLTT